MYKKLKKWDIFLISACLALIVFLSAFGFGFYYGLHHPLRPIIQAEHTLDTQIHMIPPQLPI